MHNLSELRTRISDIDSQLLELFRERLRITHEVGIFKIRNGGEIFDPAREKDIIAHVRENFTEDLEGIESLWRELMYISKREQHRTKYPHQKNPVRIGIQWGHGSFNEIAIQTFLKNQDPKTRERLGLSNYEIVYLYTTEAVLEWLNNGRIDYGQFAITNSIGGIVNETMESIGRYRWKRIANYEIPVVHALMVHTDVDIEDVVNIMGHEQAICQCEKTLSRDFPDKLRIGGVDNLTDNASIAEAVANGTLPNTTASVGHVSLADIYGLRVVQNNIQDRDDNRTTFVLASR